MLPRTSLLSILLVSFPATAFASTLTVTTNADTTVVDGACSLREAVGVVNGTANADCGPVSQPATIAFDPTYFASARTITFANADAPIGITANVTITGPGASLLTIDGANQSTIFRVYAGVTATLSGMTFQHSHFQAGTSLSAAITNQGTLTVDHVVFQDNLGNSVGAAINSPGKLTATYSLFQRNTASTGGAVYVGNGAPMATFTSCTFDDNHAPGGAGGALFVDNWAPVGIFATVFHANTATGSAGAAVLNQEATLLDVSFEGNSTTGPGGALFVGASGNEALWIERASFSGNTAGANGGAVYLNNSATTTMLDVTFAGNTAAGNGGAISGYGAETMLFYNLTITGNSANRGGGIDFEGGVLSIRNSIVSGNASGDANTPSPDCYSGSNFASIASDGYNFWGSLSHCAVDGNVGTVGASLALGPLADHGGPALGWDGTGVVRTVVPLAGSRAIGGGNPSGCVVGTYGGATPPGAYASLVARADLDARRLSRPVQVCDAGALETRCGDGTVDAGEACDDGNTSNTDACLSTCAAASCGDGFVEAGVEACDDGNTSNGDGCSATCLVEGTDAGMSDAGSPSDAGLPVDAASDGSIEAGPADGPDGSTPMGVDAGIDAGPTSTPGSGGCGCVVAGAHGTRDADGFFALALSVLVAVRLRRAHRRS